MVRNITAVLLIMAFAAQTFEGTFLVLDYYVNTGSFAQKCENKFRPQLHCNGKCLLMKKLKEQESKDQQMPERKSGNKSEVLPSSQYVFQKAPVLTPASVSYPSFIESLPEKRGRAIFHPPTA